eukprot:6605514-Prorocentrum_lima.AAC.1
MYWVYDVVLRKGRVAGGGSTSRGAAGKTKALGGYRARGSKSTRTGPREPRAVCHLSQPAFLLALCGGE